MTNNKCSCSSCNNTFDSVDCDKVYAHHDGWANEPYTKYLCPECSDGGEVDKFWLEE